VAAAGGREEPSPGCRPAGTSIRAFSRATAERGASGTTCADRAGFADRAGAGELSRCERPCHLRHVLSFSHGPLPEAVLLWPPLRLAHARSPWIARARSGEPRSKSVRGRAGLLLVTLEVVSDCDQRRSILVACDQNEALRRVRNKRDALVKDPGPRRSHDRRAVDGRTVLCTGGRGDDQQATEPQVDRPESRANHSRSGACAGWRLLHGRRVRRGLSL
jgi:hypothetical protein